MAYLRVSDTCDVYFFAHVDGGFECCGCILYGNDCVRCEGDFAHSSMEDAVLHLQEHVTAGHRGIGSDVFDQIFGYQERTPDLVLAELIDKARAQGGKVCTYDADVPAEVRANPDAFDLMEAIRQGGVFPENMIKEVLKLLGRG